MTQHEAPGSADESAIQRVLAGSRVVSALERIQDGLPVSTVSTQGARLSRIVRASFLYRWLTAEPDPDVIVIDLRETYTVGPFVRLLDRLLAALAPIWNASRLKAATDALVALGERAAETRPGRLLVALFEPPEPPEHDDAESTTDDDRDRE